jgi:TonB family protein
MTLQRSIIVSLVMHMLLLGMGLVVASYAGKLFQGHQAPIIVTLLGQDGSATNAGVLKKKSNKTPAQPEQKKPSLPNEQSLKKNSSVPMSGLSVKYPAEHEATDNNNAGGDLPVGMRSGSVSPEQWAVIVSSIERVKTYPRLARERGIQGVAQVRFKVRPTGDVESVEIVKSSGYDILDSASVRTVYRAAPMPYVAGWVEIPMAYVLK